MTSNPSSHIDNEDNGNLGITVPLSTEVAQQLRQHHPSSAAAGDQFSQKLSPLGKTISVADEDDVSENAEYDDDGKGPLTRPATDPLDDWNEVLVIPENSEDSNSKHGGEDENYRNDADSQEEGEDDIDRDKENEDDDNLSLSPPPNMPVVVVNLQRLVGRQCSSPEEKQHLEHQVHAALWYGSAEAADVKTNGNPQEDDNMRQVIDAAQHFDDRVAELMQNGIAKHGTTDDTVDPNSENSEMVIISYPEFLCSPMNEDGAPRQVLSTSQTWKQLLKEHSIPVVEKLLHLLRTCHRSLVWKHAMHQELWQLAESEEQARIRRFQATALQEWKSQKRSAQLEQLYQVRDTLQHRYEMATAKVREHEAQRERAVAMELRRQRMEGQATGGFEALDLNSTILAFPEANEWLGLEDEDKDYYDDQIGPSFVSSDDDDDNYYHQNDDGSHGSGYEAEEGDILEDDDDDVSTDNETGNSLPPANTADPQQSTTNKKTIPLPPRSSKTRRAKVAKKRQRRLQEAAKEAEHHSKLDRARSEESEARERMTSQDLKMAMAIASALQTKLESVDELLESIQEEQWADEEAEEDGKPLVPTDDLKDVNNNNYSHHDDEFSLLDQVLAMILGSFPPSTPSDDEDDEKTLTRHIKGLKAQHAVIVRDWRRHFGRLPPSLDVDKSNNDGDSTSTGGNRQSQLRSAYGIVENAAEDWDDEASDEEEATVGSSTNTAATAAAAEPQLPPNPQPAPARQTRVGLRPGGRVQR